MIEDRADFKRPFRDGRITAENLILSELNGADYDRGQVETAQAQAENTTEALGRLVNLLYSKGAISKQDVYFIALGYTPKEDDT